MAIAPTTIPAIAPEDRVDLLELFTLLAAVGVEVDDVVDDDVVEVIEAVEEDSPSVGKSSPGVSI